LKIYKDGDNMRDKRYKRYVTGWTCYFILFM